MPAPAASVEINSHPACKAMVAKLRYQPCARLAFAAIGTHRHGMFLTRKPPGGGD